MRYISRTVNASENLIRYSESTINFLSQVCHSFFPYSSSSGWKIGSKTANFHAFLNDFWPFSRQPVDWVRWNSVRSETKWIRRRRKRPDAKILSRYGDIWAQSCQKSTKITKILWMIQKFFEKIFFGSNDSKWSNSKSYHSKSEIWRPSNFFFTTRSTRLDT